MIRLYLFLGAVLSILLLLPLAIIGAFLAPRGIVLIYGPEMSDAGRVASLFCILHLFPLISWPLSMALSAAERVLPMLPYMILQVTLNILLDLLLIPRYGIFGAIGAVAGTFLLTIPLRLRVVARILGGIFFPFNFFLRIALLSMLGAAPLALVSPEIKLPGLILVAGLTWIGTLFLIRLTRAVKTPDRLYLETLNLPAFAIRIFEPSNREANHDN